VATPPRWTDADWTIDVRQRGGAVERVHYAVEGSNRLRRRIEGLTAGGNWQLVSTEVCDRGPVPPAAGVCFGGDTPARVVEWGRISMSSVPLQSPRGTLEILIALDERSRIASTSVVRSPSPYLTAAVLQAIRVSTFATATRDCRPVAAQYRLIVAFTDPRRFVMPP
jgi:hypothetical protein